MFRRLLKYPPHRPTSSPAIPDYVRLGAGCHIDDTVRFRQHDEGLILIGQNVEIWRFGELCGPVTIGNNVYINRDVYIRPMTTIGNNVSVGPFVKFVTDTHELSNKQKRAGKKYHEPIVVEDGVWIGAGAMILGNVRIGHGSVVAAGATVVSDVPPDTIVGGVPARVIKSLQPLTA